MDYGSVRFPVLQATYQVQRSVRHPDLEPALDRVLARVRLRALRRTAWLRKLWQEEGESGGDLAVTHAEIDTLLADRDAPEAEAAWLASGALVEQWERELELVEQEMAADNRSRLAQLGQLFGFSQMDADLFQTCLALALDPSLSRVYAYLQDHAGRGYVTEELVARLFGHGRTALWSSESPLHRWELVKELEVAPGEPSMLSCDRVVRNWLMEREELDETLAGAAKLHEPLPPLDGWPVTRVGAFLAHNDRQQGARPVRVHVAGLPGSGRRTLAANISAERGLALLTLDADRIEDHDWYRAYLLAQRQARLCGYALAWYGERLLYRPWPQDVPACALQFAISEVGQVIPPAPGAIEYKIELPIPSLKERRSLWTCYVPMSLTWPEEDLTMLVNQHRVPVGDIRAIGQQDVQSVGEAIDMVRELGRHRLGKLAQLLECPFGWDDLVVTGALNQALTDLTYEAKARAAFWERPEARRIFPQGRGLLGLFSGPPGTGKTMAAQVIAADLKLDLFRIDLSAVVSKYVGETSQNLELILSRAAHMDAVLLFDEADALFGKRTEIRDAHDRFANTDTAYLLQAIENYQGVALLATNKRDNIDPAFIRRIRYVLEFSKPDANLRLRIWRRIVRELAEEQRLTALEKDLNSLAQTVEVTGAQIKFTVLAALFAAQRDGEPLGMPHLLRGLERELLKEGRALSGRERVRLLNNGP